MLDKPEGLDQGQDYSGAGGSASEPTPGDPAVLQLQIRWLQGRHGAHSMGNTFWPLQKTSAEATLEGLPATAAATGVGVS